MPRTKIVKGVAVPDFKHESDDYYEAVGYSKEEGRALFEKYNGLMDQAYKSGETWSESKYTEILSSNFTPLEICIIFYSKKIDQQIREGEASGKQVHAMMDPFRRMVHASKCPSPEQASRFHPAK